MSARAPVLEALEEARLTPRYWNLAAVIMVATAFEFFDFFIIGFIASVVGPDWGLSFGETGVVLYAAGVGAIVGSFLGGWLGYRWGRKLPFIVGIAVTAGFSGSIALAPVGALWYLVLMRFAVGVGVGSMVTNGQVLIVELTPTRHRTYLAGFAGTGIIPLGVLAASALSAVLLPVIGWRGLAAIGAIPLLMCVWAVFAVPESPRWLLQQGRSDEARREVAKFTGRPVDTLSAEPVAVAEPVSPTVGSRTKGAGYAALFRQPRKAFFTIAAWLGAATAIYGINLWGPTVYRFALDISPAKAAELFIWVGVGGFLGRILFSALPHWFGRRPAGIIMGLGGAVMLLFAALVTGPLAAPAISLAVAIAVASIFVDGGFANLAPSSTEIYPTHLRSQAMGLGEVANGFGKLVGPLGLALIAGSANVVSPEATKAAVTPGLTFLAAFCLLTAVAFMMFPETRGRSLEDVQAREGVQEPAAELQAPALDGS